MIHMATWTWLIGTLGLLAVAAIWVVIPTLAVQRAKKQLVPVLVATNTRQYELQNLAGPRGYGNDSAPTLRDSA
jgi:hypothetical protein